MDSPNHSKLRIAERERSEISIVGYSYGLYVGDLSIFGEEESGDCAGFNTIDLREVVYDDENVLCIDEREFLYRFKDSAQKHQYRLLEKYVNSAKEREAILPVIEPAFEARIHVIPLDYAIGLAKKCISDLSTQGDPIWRELTDRISELVWAQDKFLRGEWCWAEVDEEDD